MVVKLDCSSTSWKSIIWFRKKIILSMWALDPSAYLSMKQGSLFCFVSLCWDLPNHKVLHVAALLTSLESFWWVHHIGLRLFGATIWKLSIIESLSQRKLNKIGTENCIGIWGCSLCCWKALNNSDLIQFISQFSKLRCEKYWFLSGFCC
jgi:hypothetical protein